MSYWQWFVFKWLRFGINTVDHDKSTALVFCHSIRSEIAFQWSHATKVDNTQIHICRSYFKMYENIYKYDFTHEKPLNFYLTKVSYTTLLSFDSVEREVKSNWQRHTCGVLYKLVNKYSDLVDNHNDSPNRIPMSTKRGNELSECGEWMIRWLPSGKIETQYQFWTKTYSQDSICRDESQWIN